MPEPTAITATEVATKFRRNGRWFLRQRRKLEAAGFPKPLPCTHERLWSNAAVDQWFDGRTGSPSQEGEDLANVVRARSERIAAGLSPDLPSDS